MKERPILFSAPMVRAIRRGTNPKTQTRRIVKPTPQGQLFKGMDGWWRPGALSDDRREWRPQYGSHGDRLWVRETFSRTNPGGDDGIYFYRADGQYPESLGPHRTFWPDQHWTPSIHMPRAASRITLELTRVHIERLQDISPDDAIAEGLSCLSKDGGRTFKYGIPDRDGLPGEDDDGWPWHLWRISPVDAYQALWERINGPGSWAANPWVWAIAFTRTK